MKWIKRLLLFLASLAVMPLIVFLLIPVSIPRQDILECGLPASGKFVLTNSWKWYPFAAVFPADIQSSDYESDWKVVYQDERGFLTSSHSKPPWPARRSHHEDGFREACSEFGRVGIVPVTKSSYQKPDGTWFYFPSFEPGHKLAISPSWHRNWPAAIEQAGIVAVGMAWVMPYQNGVVREQALFKQNVGGAEYRVPIDAVYQSFSTDGGQNWSDPQVVTANAKIIEIGKSRVEQSFVAQPVRLNGKKLEPFEVQRARQIREAAEQEAERVQERARDPVRLAYAKGLRRAIDELDRTGFEAALRAGAAIDAAEPKPQDEPRAPLAVALEKPESAPFALSLIQAGADVQPIGMPRGATALMLAAGNSTPEVIMALMARQTFRIDEANPNGATPLGYAVAAGRIDNVRLLLKLGADPRHLSGKDNLTDIARWQGREDIARLLQEASQ